MSTARSDPLSEYKRRRNFSRTKEPQGSARRRRKKGLLFLVQKHDARRLHYDLRLEWNGVLKSWAVTRGPSLAPSDRRLAVRTEDHPLAYADFEGVIPEGEYGGGAVMIWDTGEWEPRNDPDKGLKQGTLHFIAHGERMKGEWILVRMRRKDGEKRENWLLMKADDEEASDRSRPLTERFATSVASGRKMEDIAAEGSEHANRVARHRTRRAGNVKMPGFRKPQLAILVDNVPAGDDWLHELKFDGYRALVSVAGGRARCYTRSGLDWTDRFRPIADVCAGLECRSALIDGEVVAGTEDGPSQFSALQRALKHDAPLRYYAFDLLSLDGKDLRELPLLERKERLRKLLGSVAGSKTVQFSEHVRGSGGKVFRSVCRAGREGIVSKRADASYDGRRTRSWLKVKCTHRQEFVIGGYSPSDKRSRPFASLLLGTYEEGRLRYRGRVGTGFSGDTLAELGSNLHNARRKTSPFEGVPGSVRRDAVWVSPKFVAEVDFTEFTTDGYVRHGTFVGLRGDKEAKEVTIETPARVPASGESDDPTVAGIRITHPDRVLYRQQGLTKLELARYYEAVAARMLPFLEDRLLSIVRCPQGRQKSCFYQRHAGDGFPDAIERIDVRERSGKTGSYLYVTDIAGVIAACQMGTLEFHIWWSKIDDLERPDRIVFDLDPDDEIDFGQVKRSAVDMRDRLADLGLDSFALVTGGKGVHVVVPLVRRVDGDEAKGFAEAFARMAVADEPDRYTATMSKAKRQGRIFIDWLRNERGATAIAPYSTRAREGAPVATPVSWDELVSLKAANLFRPSDVLRRLDEADPWGAISGLRQSITGEMRKTVGA